MQREMAPLDRDIIVALTADEEGGPDNGVAWLLRQHRALVDGGLVINEGGGGGMRGQVSANEVQASEKTYIDFTLEVANKGGHSSMPTPDNAIYRWQRAGRLPRPEFPVELNDVTRAFFGRWSIETRQPAADMRAVAATPDTAAARSASRSKPRYNARLRTTCVATELTAATPRTRFRSGARHRELPHPPRRHRRRGRGRRSRAQPIEIKGSPAGRGRRAGLATRSHSCRPRNASPHR